MANNLVAQLAKEFISGGTDDVVDVVSFIEAPWGLGIKLLPVQKFVLRCLYGLPLNGTDKTIEVPDMTNERILYTFTEKDFQKWLYAEGRTNVDETEGKIFQELVMAVGRRGTKCRDKDDRIATTEGSITFGELCDRLGKGEGIGVGTYDPVTLRYSVSRDAKAEYNRNMECFEVETRRGIREASSWNHPYLVWRDEWEKPEFVEMRDLRVGDKIATASCVGLFGRGGVGVARAALLGHFQGDGGTTCSAGYSTASDVMLGDFTRLVETEFPGYVVRKKGKDSWRVGYEVVKTSGKFKQNGSQKNEVREWLKDVGCFGKKAVVKEVPDCILRGNREEVVAFLSRLFGCDGWASTEKSVSKGHRGVPKSHIGYCSASRRLAEGVRHLLLKFGVYGSMSKRKAVCDGKEFDAWNVQIVRKDSLEKFRAEIGIFSKEAAVDKAVEASRTRSDAKSEFDCVPRGVWNYVRRIMRERGLSGADVVGEHGRGSSSRLRWDYAPSRWKVAAYGTRTCDEFLRAMGTSDVMWDEVESVKPVGKRTTVDVEIPGTHIIGGDVVSHNSTLASCISNYEMYKLVKRGDSSKFYGFPAGTVVSILNVAPTDDQSGIVFDMTQSMAMRCPYMKDRSVHQTMSYFDIQTDYDLKSLGKPKASLISIAGGCSSNSLRGRNAIVVIMDEMAHFIDNNGRFSGSEVYKALTPSIANFRRDGKIICISSPYAKYGSFYDRYVQSANEKDITLMFKMYSAMVNPTIPSEILRAARRRDRSGFMCEYGGEFSDSVMAWVEDEAEFRKCVGGGLEIRGKPEVAYYFGLDLGFKNDGTAVAVVHKDDAGKIVLDTADVWYSASSDVWEFDDSIYRNCRKYADKELLMMSDVVEEMLELSMWFPAKQGVFDQHNGYALAELLAAKSMKQFEMESFSDNLISEVYQLAKRLYSEGLLVIPDHPVLVPEMLSLEAEKRTGQKVIVRQPNRRGSHNDISDAFVRAVWLCYNGFKSRPMNVTMGAGGRSHLAGVGTGPAERRDTQAAFFLRKLKSHGDHPRGLYSVRGRKLSQTAGSMLGI